MRSKGQFPRRELPNRPLPRVSLLSASIRYREGERERERKREDRGNARKEEREREEKKEKAERHTVSRKLSFCKTTRIMRVPAGGVVSFLRKKEGAISLLAGSADTSLY